MKNKKWKANTKLKYGKKSKWQTKKQKAKSRKVKDKKWKTRPKMVRGLSGIPYELTDTTTSDFCHEKRCFFLFAAWTGNFATLIPGTRGRGWRQRHRKTRCSFDSTAPHLFQCQRLSVASRNVTLYIFRRKKVFFSSFVEVEYKAGDNSSVASLNTPSLEKRENICADRSWNDGKQQINIPPSWNSKVICK